MPDAVAAKLTSVRDKFELRGRNYVITGGGQGIGFAVSQAICEMGGNVAVLDIRPKPIEEFDALASRYGVKTAYFRTDVSSIEAIEAGFAGAISALGSIDGLVTAAGIAIDKPFVDQTPDEFMQIQKVNVSYFRQDVHTSDLANEGNYKVFGTFFSAQWAVKQMQKQGTKGSIVLIASIVAHVGLPSFRMSSYNTSKGGVLMLAKALATELAPSGIRVNSISPAFIDTEQTKTARDAAPEKAGVMWSQPPLGRIGEADELTGLAIYLLSDASSYTTGSDVLVSGGIHVGRHTDYQGL